jgi:Rrf2 family protein
MADGRQSCTIVSAEALAPGGTTGLFQPMISQRARYAFKALMALAGAGGRGMQIRDIAAKEEIPRKFLEQILLSMKAGGLIVSRRGREGGYTLLKPPEQISLGAVLRLIDGPIAPLPCLSRTAYRKCDDCASEERCSVRAGFSDAYDASLQVLEMTSIADAIRKAEPGDVEAPTSDRADAAAASGRLTGR